MTLLANAKNYLAIDYGEKRIGLAYCDDMQIAFPLACANQNTLQKRLDFIKFVMLEKKIDELVIGYPLNMDGSISKKAMEVDSFLKVLLSHILPEFSDIKTHLVDERLSSYQAEQLSSYKPKSKNKNLSSIVAERRQGTIDSKAAAIILNDFLQKV